VDSFTLLFVNDVHTSQETHVWTCTTCYFLYLDGVHTSHEAHLWVSTVCYGDKFTFTLLHMEVLNFIKLIHIETDIRVVGFSMKIRSKFYFPMNGPMQANIIPYWLIILLPFRA
jgi:hypothetical protein